MLEPMQILRFWDARANVITIGWIQYLIHYSKFDMGLILGELESTCQLSLLQSAKYKQCTPSRELDSGLSILN
ncbi:hypothetical protein Leryth_000315 [Lithospermum erythrorhizon]|nr:hypothetical protein Leryth_000315 [Lithospermum erythrorhizon]